MAKPLRGFTRTLAAINIIFLVAVVGTFVLAPTTPISTAPPTHHGVASQAATTISPVTRGAIVALAVAWLLVDLILGLAWYLTRPKGEVRRCPVCAVETAPGGLICQSCGHDVTQPAPWAAERRAS